MSEQDTFAGLEPAGLWREFAAITKIARPSGREQAISEHIKSWAAARKFEVRQDEVGNLCVRVPARPGREGAPVVVLQGHLDMVCERDSDSPYDPEQGNIRVVRDGEWIKAEGTTLGADNGIGLAAMLQVAADPTVAHGPLDLLFTVDEETGLTGASKLDPNIIRGRILLNLDSEDDGELTVGCAGSGDVTLRWSAARQVGVGGLAGLTVKVSGLRGGHSGMDIDKGRLNAVRALARLLQAAADVAEVRLTSIKGGNKRNAIPRECEATVYYLAAQDAAVREAVELRRAVLADQFRGLEDGLAVRQAAAEPTEGCFSTSDTRRLLDLICGLPCGVVAMSQDIPGLVETSNNVGSVDTTGDRVEIACLARSASAPGMRDVLDTIRAVGRLGRSETDEAGGYPGWKPDLSSRALAAANRAFRKVFGSEPKVAAVHAGLECGLIGEKIPGMDMVSFGPDIKGPHAPGERVNGESVGRFWRLLVAVLDDLSAGGGPAG